MFTIEKDSWIEIFKILYITNWLKGEQFNYMKTKNNFTQSEYTSFENVLVSRESL